MTDRASKPLPNQLLLPFPEEDEEPGDRIVTPRFTKDVDELRTYVMECRQVLSDGDWRTATTKDTKVNDDRCNHRMPGVTAHTKE